MSRLSEGTRVSDTPKPSAQSPSGSVACFGRSSTKAFGTRNAGGPSAMRKKVRAVIRELRRLGFQDRVHLTQSDRMGKRQKGSHEALVSHDTFDRVQEVLGGKPRPRNKRRHAFMGLLTCERCGCAMTAEIKKGKYVYYRCTGFKGRCGNAYVREERLAELLGDVIAPFRSPRRSHQRSRRHSAPPTNASKSNG